MHVSAAESAASIDVQTASLSAGTTQSTRLVADMHTSATSAAVAVAVVRSCTITIDADSDFDFDSAAATSTAKAAATAKATMATPVVDAAAAGDARGQKRKASTDGKQRGGAARAGETKVAAADRKQPGIAAFFAR